jgi:ABC-2 type transport system ATP-binding protein
MQDNAINVNGTTKKFGKVLALNNINLVAAKGKVTGLLGPNGAGKSTLIRVMTTLLTPDSGSVIVDGVNVINNADEARRHIGLAGQSAAVDDFLTGRETLQMVSRLYGLSKKESVRRSNEILEKLDLVDAADRQAKTYSGGMRRRLDLGASLVASPKVLFLDEPTTGLDPRTRLQLWDIIRDLVKQGVSILLTTQYLDEADALCDYIYLIDKGNMVIEGTAEKLKRSLGQDIIELKVAAKNLEATSRILSDVMSTEVKVDNLTRRITLHTKSGATDLLKIADALKNKRIQIEELSLHRPSLDDVFLAVTGEEKK